MSEILSEPFCETVYKKAKTVPAKSRHSSWYEQFVQRVHDPVVLKVSGYMFRGNNSSIFI